MSAFLFYAFGAIAVIGALGMVANVRNTVAGAMSLVASMVALGGVFLLLEAYLIAVLQILVYAGAIVVLFLFVVMLLNLREERLGGSRQQLFKALGGGGVALLSLQLLWLLGPSASPPAVLAAGFGGYRSVGLLLFTDYVLAVELASLLLLAAMVGSVILAKRSID